MKTTTLFALLVALAVSPVMAEKKQEPVIPLQQVANALAVAPRVEGSQFVLPIVKDADVRFLGADYEQLIRADGTVVRPLVDTKVKVSFTVCRGNETVVSRDYDVIVPGLETPTAGANPQPFVFPELLNWLGGTGSYTLGETVTVSGATPQMAAQLTAELSELLGRKVVVA